MAIKHKPNYKGVLEGLENFDLPTLKTFADIAGNHLKINNTLDYFEKRKKCQEEADRADTVAEGKRYYKNCMED